jgi:hypothetical protein
MAPEIFGTIYFTSAEASANSALAAVEAHGWHTLRIEFECNCGPDDEVTMPALAAAASKVLGGTLTPNLRTVQLDFAFDFYDGQIWGGDDFPTAGSFIHMFKAIENDACIRAAERN